MQPDSAHEIDMTGFSFEQLKVGKNPLCLYKTD